ncbi:MAG: Fis family transcriptional regulator [Betaproteobacteria bacterium HGW-Betaproteobacteria-7]|jgi:two-component system C4-dicarboxylate transport response regulator DctD|nr:MAG: Fis family transcriptional regulator [Betaproteobacteria bacterium HGW-Betaproteobacteria-7]
MKTPLQVLLVEDDPNVRLGCEQAMQLAGIPVIATASAEEAEKHLTADFPGIVVTDMRLPGRSGMELLRRVRERDADLPVIIITGHGDVTLAVEAMRNGAYDFMQKPFSTDDLVEVVRRALEKRELVLEVESLRRRLDQRDDLEARLIGRSPLMQRVRRLILDVADASVDVLIFGETGTGKEMVARCLHDLSQAGRENYVALNCGGMADNLLDSELFGHESGAFTGAQKRRIGKIEYASGGTLFLDEVESMPMNMQIKLLRVLQERVIERLGSNQQIPVNCRVIAASKEDLKAWSEQGKFRADLYYRLNVVRIELPPLRERREDIPALYDAFLLQAAKRFNRPPPLVPPETMHRLMAQEWPGNIRELKNAADCHALGIGGATPSVGQGVMPSLTEAVEGYERQLIADEFTRQGGNIQRTADVLKVARTTLHDKLKKYGLL